MRIRIHSPGHDGYTPPPPGQEAPAAGGPGGYREDQGQDIRQCVPPHRLPQGHYKQYACENFKMDFISVQK